MKNKLQKSLLFGILILGISLFSNCEKDDSITSEQQNPQNVHRISLNDFNSKINKDDSYNKLQSYFYSNKKNEVQSYNRIEQGDDIIVLTNDILLIQKDDINYYTFKVLTNNSGDEFYNLVIHVNNNQEIIKSEIYEYNPTEVWLQDTSQPYSGYVSVVENDIIDIDSIFARAGNDCVVGASGYWECSYGNTGDDHAPGECNGTSSNYIIELEYGPCSNDGQAYIAGDEEASGGGGTWSPTGGGGNNTGNDNQDNTNDTDDDTTPVIPMEPTVQEEILNCINGLSLLGSSNQTYIDTAIFEQLNLSKFQWAEINSNLEDNNCSEEAQQDVIEELLEIFDEQIFLDDDFSDNTCLKSVYNDMGKASTFKSYLENFEAEFSVAHLRFSSSTTLAADTNAETSAPQNYLITITFNENNLNRPRLSVARTMIHEMIHAEIFRKLLSVAQHPSIQLDQNQLIQLRNDYPGLYDYYMRWKWNIPQGQSPSSAQHEAMAQHYRGIIKQALEEFDNSQTDEIYEALAWTGLQNTVAWNSLSQTERDNINQNVTTFFANNPNCQ
jgi:hypothetical protein